ncbi:asparaginase [Labrenzia sp. C1B10]|uniref:asparaginase n=1 Tax=unclassified Labrenzia TaxID=2648686 RepID=UPI0003B8837F|nr:MULTISPECIES: asparaginase [unclassified Labrenzia]ERP94126.1 asparaginase [Labrenzia sp. C1B10]ERS05047.1 asparaginase [Labrenzia sp. C1B70]
MDNPALVDVTRGTVIESLHRGSIAIVDSAGKLVFGIGNVEARVFPRSAIKALQALPLVESGAAEALDYSDAELALACASHNGEEVHANSARVMLMKAGLAEDNLECGPQWPQRMEDAAKLILADESPCGLHNNCSGKHAGFLGLAKVMGVETRGYVNAEHPVQREVRNVMEQMTGDTLSEDVCGTDGCSIPTYASPLRSFARAFAAFGTGEGLEPLRAEAAERLFDACINEPYMVAGTGRFCTRVMEAFRGRVFVKTGAEGVFCASVPELGFGVALKCDDGATRASEVMMATVLEAMLELNDDEAALLDGLVNPPILTRVGIQAGHIKPREEFLTELKAALP